MSEVMNVGVMNVGQLLKDIKYDTNSDHKYKDKYKDKVTKRPNMCYIFENDMAQGCQI